MMATAKRSLMAVVAVGVLMGLVFSGPASAQDAVSILGMAWTPKPAPALVISASGPLTFTKAQPEPGVTILEFPEAVLAKPMAGVEQPAAGLTRAALVAVNEGDKHWARLRIESDPAARLSVAALPSGVEVRVARSAAADAAARPGELDDVLAVADSAGVSVQLTGRGPFVGKTFTLTNPPRVVVDLPGVINRVAHRVQAVGAGGVERVRVAQHASSPEPVVRIAIDLEKAMPYHFETTSQGAMLRLGGAAAVAAPQPVTPPAAPVVAAAGPAPADSPWTTTPAAMAEQAAPPTTVSSSTHEVESQEKRFTGEPISLELKDADIKDVLRTFAKITGLNVVVDPDVTGSVTVNLENVPWDQCLDLILKINRLDYVVENNVLRVARIDRLTQEKAQQAAYRKEAENARPMRTVTKTLSYAKASAVKSVLTSQSFILSDRGSVVVDDRTNTLIIRDATDKIEGILNLIDSLDQPNPQVVIEARIVETTRTFSQSIGTVWGYNLAADAAHGTTTGLKFPNSISSTGQVVLGQPGNGIISIGFADILDSFNLNFALQAAEANGLVKIVSSPKVTAQNNEKAHIQSGILLPIQTVANNTVTVQYIDATLSLDVTPQITAEGTVLLDIDLKKREPLSGINLQSGNNAPISTRDAKTRVMVRDGGTTVIGGIYQLTENDQRNGIPGLSKLPIIGALFRNRNLSTQHDELLIFITPRIIKY